MKLSYQLRTNLSSDLKENEEKERKKGKNAINL